MVNPISETDSLKFKPNLTVSTKIVEAQNITTPMPIPKTRVKIVVINNSVRPSLP